MNKITFDYVEGEGFRSLIKPFHFNLNRPGLNLVKGVNGRGKTSIFETIVWCLFGITLKETNLESVVTWEEDRPSTWIGTRISVTFHVGHNVYCVTRHVNYKGTTYDVKGGDYLMLAKGDDDRGHKVELTNYLNKAETQEAIITLLGMDSRIFMNSVLFGQRIAKLIASDNSDKRKLFETLFEVEWVKELKDKVDTDIKDKELKVAIKTREIQNIESGIEQKKLRLSQAEEMMKGYEENRYNRILNKQTESSQISDSIKEMIKDFRSLKEAADKINYDPDQHNKVEADYNALKDEIQAARLSVAKIEGQKRQDQLQLEHLRTAIKRAETDLKAKQAVKIEGNCPYCAQELREGNKLEQNHAKELTQLKTVLKDAKKTFEAFERKIAGNNYNTQQEIVLSQMERRLEDLSVSLNNFNKLEGTYNDIWSRIQKQKDKIVQCEKDIIRIEKEIEAIKAEKPPKIDLKAIEKEIDTDKETIAVQGEALLSIQEELESAKWWSGKAFGSGGIKAFIFQAMLSQLNQNVKKYGSRLGVSLEFSIDLNKASKPFTTRCSIGSKLDKDYRDFSGGQKQRLDICLMFAMQDLISMSTNINILILDEVFEGLDEEGEGAVFDLIRMIAEEGKSVYVISHSAVLDSLYSNTILFDTDLTGNTIIQN